MAEIFDRKYMYTNTGKRLSWTAVISGAIVGFGVNFLLNLLSLAIGLSSFSYTSLNSISFSLPGFSGFIIVAIISMFATGWVAGILSNTQVQLKWWGALYGFIAWGICLIFTTLIITNMIQFSIFHSNFTSQPNFVSIRITNDAPMLTEVKTSTDRIPAAVESEMATKTIILNAYVTFSLFLIGAISSGVGGYLGFSQQLYYRQRMSK